MSIREANSIRVLNGGSSQSEREKNNFMTRILSQFNNDNPSYFEVTKNENIPVGAIITDNSTSAKGEKLDSSKSILLKPSEVLNIGDIFLYLGKDFICTLSEKFNDIYYKGIIQESNNILKFYSPQSNLISIPCIVNKGNINLSIDKFISLASDEYIVSLPNTVDSSNIDLNTRFILSGSAYKVLGIDPISNVGLLDIRIKEDQIVVDDRVDLNIANWYSHQHTYVVSIINGVSALFRQNETLQLNVSVLDNSVEILPTPTVIYSSSNINICIVSATGLITGVSVGACIITSSYGTVSTSIAITISAVIYDNYTVDITGLTTVKLNSSITLASYILNNGIEDLSKTVLWSFSNQDLSSNVYASLVSSTGNSLVLKATINSSYVNKFVVVRATKSDDFSKFFDFVIQVKSLL